MCRQDDRGWLGAYCKVVSLFSPMCLKDLRANFYMLFDYVDIETKTMLLVFYFGLKVKGQRQVFVSIQSPQGNVLQQEFERFKAFAVK